MTGLNIGAYVISHSGIEGTLTEILPTGFGTVRLTERSRELHNRNWRTGDTLAVPLNELIAVDFFSLDWGFDAHPRPPRGMHDFTLGIDPPSVLDFTTGEPRKHGARWDFFGDGANEQKLNGTYHRATIPIDDLTLPETKAPTKQRINFWKAIPWLILGLAVIAVVAGFFIPVHSGVFMALMGAILLWLIYDHRLDTEERLAELEREEDW